MPDAIQKTASKTLPSVSILFKESWEAFKGSIFNLFILYLISFALFIGLGIIGLLISVPLGALSVFSVITENSLTPAFFTSVGAMGIVILIFIIIAITIGLALNAAMIMVVANYKDKPKAGSLLKKGFSFALPLFLAGVVTGFIVIGGYFLLVIPGIIFGLAFSFTYYEIVLNKKTVFSAMRRSMGIVFSNFWGILGRMLLFMVIVFSIVFIPRMLVGAVDDSGFSSAVGFLSFFIQLLIGWYAISYSVTLYKQADAAAPVGKSGKLIIPIILAVIGWIIGIILLGAVITALSVFIKNFNPSSLSSKDGISAFQKLQGSDALKKALENPTEENVRAILDLLPTGSPERAQLEVEIERQFRENGMMDKNYMMPSPAQN